MQTIANMSKPKRNVGKKSNTITLGQEAERLAQKIVGEVAEGVCLFLVLARRNPIGEVGYVTSTTPAEAQSFMETMVANKAFLPTPPKEECCAVADCAEVTKKKARKK